jgi:hypothetical protein
VSDDRAQLLGEAYKRGLLPPDMRSAYEQAQQRGLLGGQAKSAPESPELTAAKARGWDVGDLWEGFKYGAGQMVRAGAQIGARMGEAPEIGQTAPSFTPTDTARVDQYAKQKEAEYQALPEVQAHPWASGIGKVGGEMATVAPFAAIPGGQATLPGRLGAAAVTGALLAPATQPATGEGSFGAQKGWQAGEGAAGGVAGQGIGEVGAGAARTIFGGVGTLWDRLKGEFRAPEGLRPPPPTPETPRLALPAPPTKIVPEKPWISTGQGMIPGSPPGIMHPGPPPTVPPRPVRATPITRPTAPPPPSIQPSSSPLASAIANNDHQAVDRTLIRAYRVAVKPSRLGQRSEPQLQAQDRNIMSAVDEIAKNKAALRFTDENNNVVTGRLPRSLREFSEAIDQMKTKVFRLYDDMAQKAGQQGARVDLAPVVAELRRIATTPGVVDSTPSIARDAAQMADRYEARGYYSAEEAQDAIEHLNAVLKPYWRNPTAETVSHASLLAPVVRTLRSNLDDAITKYQGAGWQQLRLRYGALKSVENDVAGAVQRDANKLPGGIGGLFADIASSTEAIHGIPRLIFLGDPTPLARAAAIKAGQMAVRYVNSPNRAITQIFERRATAAAPGLVRRYAPGVGALGGALSLSQIGQPGPQGGIVRRVEPVQ